MKSVRFPKFVGIILQNLLGKMFGHFKHVPEIILNSDKIFRKLFLRALFDDVGRRKYKKPWRDQFRFIISGRRNIESYYKEIGFDHPEKKEKLRISLQNYEMTYYKP
ncbi:MAG: hypothetical protein QMD36_00170 [Candidatus Aenigmarchaeota archaeon]|nr:hypothetical protein [Candidatus Aenigmarchaeota archaeon]